MPNVSQAEARVLVEAVRRRARFMVRLRARMEKTRRTADPLYPAVRDAAEAMRGLWLHLHYRACGVGRPPSATDSSLSRAPRPRGAAFRRTATKADSGARPTANLRPKGTEGP